MVFGFRFGWGEGQLSYKENYICKTLQKTSVSSSADSAKDLSQLFCRPCKRRSVSSSAERKIKFQDQILHHCHLRPYHDEHTRSRLITEVKHRRARIVLGWGPPGNTWCRRLFNLFRIIYLDMRGQATSCPGLLQVPWLSKTSKAQIKNIKLSKSLILR